MQRKAENASGKNSEPLRYRLANNEARFLQIKLTLSLSEVFARKCPSNEILSLTTSYQSLKRSSECASNSARQLGLIRNRLFKSATKRETPPSNQENVQTLEAER